MQEDAGKALLLHILAEIERNGERPTNTRTVAQERGFDHDEVVRVVKSMIANELVTAEQV
jgi:DNA-binding MarR family transcriptional regulator